MPTKEYETYVSSLKTHFFFVWFIKLNQLPNKYILNKILNVQSPIN